MAACVLASCQQAPKVAPAAPSPSVVVGANNASRGDTVTREGSTACLTRDAADAGLLAAWLDGAQLKVCYRFKDKDFEGAFLLECVILDVAYQVLAVRAEDPQVPQAEPLTGFTVRPGRGGVEICPPGPTACAVVKPGYLAARIGFLDSHVAAVNRDGSRLLVAAPQMQGDRVTSVFIDVFSVATGRRESRVPLHRPPDGPWRAWSSLWHIKWPGKVAVLADSAPGGAEYLLFPETGVTRFLHGYGGSLVAVPALEQTALNLNGKLVSIVSLSSGTLSASKRLPGADIDDPEEIDALAVIEGKTAHVAFGNPPGIVSLNLHSGLWGEPTTFDICD